MTNLGPRQERQAMIMSQSVRLHVLAVENYFTGIGFPTASDDQDAIERLDYAVKSIEVIKRMVLKENESVTES